MNIGALSGDGQPLPLLPSKTGTFSNPDPFSQWIRPMQFKRFLQSLGLAFGLTLSSSFLALPIRAADKITFVYPPFGQFDVSIQDLSNFAA
ncbi:MAG: hypothetical protein ACKO5Q_00300, partial [Microcystaceae cyanobacterium]